MLLLPKVPHRDGVMQFLGDVAQQVRKAASHEGEPNRSDYAAISTPVGLGGLELDDPNATICDHDHDHDHEQGSLNGCTDASVAPFSKRGLLGLKRITLFGSIVCVANNIAGPGMVVLPQVYQVG